jgi:predicted flap endonuclease-1-like 5' DNA nuclease
MLNDRGITRYEQIAALSREEVNRLDEHLGAFKGRLSRDRIVEQAAYLARGDQAGYEAEFGKL